MNGGVEKKIKHFQQQFLKIFLSEFIYQFSISYPFLTQFNHTPLPPPERLHQNISRIKLLILSYSARIEFIWGQ